LLGSHLVYNTVKVIDQQSVDLLDSFARRAQLFRTRTSVDNTLMDTPEFLSARSFPPLTWVVEDFVQEREDVDVDSGKSWLRTYYSQKVDPLKVPFLESVFKNLTVRTLFLPATNRESLVDLSKLRFEELTSEFKREVGNLRRHLLKNLMARQFEGNAMTASTFERILRFIVQNLQRGKFHELPSLWVTWANQVEEMSFKDAESWFEALILGIDTDHQPIPLREFNDKMDEARGKAIKFYEEMLRDFNTAPQINKLKNSMKISFQRRVSYYHERILSWVEELISIVKGQFQMTLQSVDLPIEPARLDKLATDEINLHALNFKKRMDTFGTPSKKVPLYGESAQMPRVDKSRNRMDVELRALQGVRESENDRMIDQFFKIAAAAADEIVEAELRTYGSKILGDTKLQELKKLVWTKCYQASEDHLKVHAWLRYLPRNEKYKLQVKSRFEGRISAYSATNQKRLSVHFRALFEQTVHAVDNALDQIRFPLAEEDLEIERARIQNMAQAMLAENGSELCDTSVYVDLQKELARSVYIGFERVTRKNVEFWKVDSDKATRCALAENERANGACGPFCLFNKAPFAHRRASKRHLHNCLLSSGSRMTPSMEEKVFYSWYTKDLAKDVAVVYTHFCMLAGTFVIGLIVLCIVMKGH